MRVRAYHPADDARLKEIYEAQGFKFRYPDLSDPIFFSKLVLVDRGRLEMAVIGRMTSEVYLFVDPKVGTPEERNEKFRLIHDAAEEDFLAAGMVDAHCWLPPSHKNFGRRLVRDYLWVRDDEYTPFCKYLVPK